MPESFSGPDDPSLSATTAELTTPLNSSEHWADFYLRHPEDPHPFKNESDSNNPQLVVEASDHNDNLWVQQQVLLELIFSKAEGRQAMYGSELMSPTLIKELGLPKYVFTKNSSLVDSFYRRMGPNNSMRGSAMLMTVLAGLVVADVNSDGETNILPTSNEQDIFIRSAEAISAFIERISHDPSSTEGKETQLLLIADLLSEAQRLPSTNRPTTEIYSEFSDEQFNADFYQRNVVVICESIIDNLQKTDPLTEDASNGKKINIDLL